MPRAKKPPKSRTPPPAPEWWTVPQVAIYMRLAPQTARTQMMQGLFGETQYDPRTRKLRVLASRVQREKIAREKRRKAEQAKAISLPELPIAAAPKK